MRAFFKSSISVSALLAASLGAGTAMAQDGAAVSTTDNSNTMSSADTDTNAIIVTGTRRSENLQNVAVSISALSGDQLTQIGLKSAQELQYAVPGLSYNPQLGAGYLIRGLGTQGFDYSLDKAVGVVVDDVAQDMPRTMGFSTFGDVADIEVLKGPQGTLFGKNASAGVIYVTTKKPQLGVYSLTGSMSGGERREMHVDDTINIPVTDNLAIRATGVYQRQDGFLDNLYNNTKGGGYRDYAVRGKLLWKPTDTLEVYLLGDIQSHTDGGLGGLATIRNLAGSTSAGWPTNPASTYNVDFAQLLADYGITPGPNSTSYAHNSTDKVWIKQKDLQANIALNLGDYTLRSITAYGHVQSGSWFDQDYTQTDFYNLNNSISWSRQFSQELRLNSPVGGFVDYVVGLYAYDMKTKAYERSAGTRGQDLPDDTLYSYSGAMMNYRAHNRSYAAYGEANWHFTNTVTLTTGLRFTHDRAQANYFPSADIDYTFIGPTPNPAVSGVRKATNLSGKATLKWQPTQDLMFYATYARGYKSPAVGVASGVLRPVKPETVDSFELGARMSLLDNKLTLNGTLFYEKFKNFQTTVIVLGDDGISRSLLSNVPGVISRGVEGDINFRPTHDISLGANFSYAPTKYQGFNAPCYSGQTVQATASQGACYTYGSGTALDASGLPSIQAPKFTYTVNAAYNPMLTQDLQLFANANWYHRSSAWSQAGNPNTIVGGYGLLGGNIGVGSPDGKYKISIYARNLLNKLYWSRYGTMTFAPAGSYLQYAASDAARTIGVRLDYSF